ncbi:alpha/beta hydrolase-fold protein [Roseibium limicola]|uniref:DUF3327 domain-containing protein n=1 Tax=Roseibium limicola TaxID=2816037 RepID=A0A939ENW0_9HYPH|nr:alpha/beta hydrolase-fold protein [Roseibium limicola]MBO0345600.1 DUF3327 domain-containing protein [Roseibium limicola]
MAFSFALPLIAAASALDGATPASAQTATAPASPIALSIVDQGWVWEVSSAAGTTSQLALDLPAGSYVAVTVDSGSADLVVDLKSADGSFLRRLTDSTDWRRDFNLVVGAPGTYLEAVISPEASIGSAKLTFAKIVTPEHLTGVDASDDTLLSPTLQALAEQTSDPQAIAAFWQDMQTNGTPLIEPAGEGKSLLTFLYQGAGQNVRILGSPSADHDYMHRLEGTDVWYRSYEVPNDTRLSYRLAPDIPDVPGTFWENRIAILSTAQADPLNLNPWPAEAADPWRQKSVIELADAPAQPFVAPDDSLPAGTVETLQFTSERLDNTRDVTFYRPDGFDPADPQTVLLVLFDGDAYQQTVDVPGILDRMQGFGVLPQTAAVLISNPDMKARGMELPGSQDFSDVMAQDLLPWAQQQLGLQVPAVRTVLAGSSYGGLASMRLALDHPDTFGNVISMSGSFWWAPKDADPAHGEHTAYRVATTPKQELRVFLTAGLFETSRDGSLDILNTNRHLRDVLVARGYPATMREYAGSHDYLIWRGALSDGLTQLFGPAP